MKKHIPNLLTSLNLFSGCVSILLAFRGNLPLAAGFVILSALLDFSDGLAARLLNAYSAIGKELDSLADVVSFGVAPSAVLYQLVIQHFTQFHPGFEAAHPSASQWIMLLIPFLIPVFSALRLAKFNLDERQTTHFIGLPTPANALFFLSLVFWEMDSPAGKILLHPASLSILTLLFCFLLVSSLPMFSLKTHSLRWSENRERWILGILSLFLLAWLGIRGLTFVIPLYLLISLILSFRPSIHAAHENRK